MADQQPELDTWPKRDEVSDEDGPHPSRDVPRDRAHDAPTTGRLPSRDVDPDSAESLVDRDDTGEEA